MRIMLFTALLLLVSPIHAPEPGGLGALANDGVQLALEPYVSFHGGGAQLAMGPYVSPNGDSAQLAMGPCVSPTGSPELAMGPCGSPNGGGCAQVAKAAAQPV